MGATHKDIRYQLAKAIYTALNGTITVGGVTYPVYQGVSTDAVSTYVRIGEIIDRDNGTKESFIYEGTVPLIINDESQINIFDKKLLYSIADKVRSLLKTSKSSVLSLTGFTMTVFAFDTSSEIVVMNDEDRPQIQVVDIYRFIIE